MKKKIVALALVFAMAAIAIVGGTLAYLTSRDQVVNTFTVGNVKIDLYEYTDYDGDGKLNLDKKFQQELKYSDIMPGDALPKVPYVENTGNNTAYVRVAVVMNHVSAINDAIDGVYEDKGYTAEQIQAVYDEVFNGWGINYGKRTADSRRMWMDSRVGEGSKVLCNIDTYAQLEDSSYEYYGMYDINNQFQSDIEKWRTENIPDGFIYGDDEASYYSCIEDEERIYVFYLKLEPGEKYKLFDGLNVPADFNADQLAMFEDLQIGIYADAIQADGFETYTEAFNALQTANPLGWWK